MDNKNSVFRRGGLSSYRKNTEVMQKQWNAGQVGRLLLAGKLLLDVLNLPAEDG